jgi:ribonuclease BN (tRNA processing enzyme)
MRIEFLGTNGWFDTAAGRTACVLIQTGREHIILDAGMGLAAAAPRIRDRKPVYLFLSHFHLDHLYGIHALNLFDLPQGIAIYGPRGIRRHLGALLRRPYTMPPAELRTPVTLHDLAQGDLPPLDVTFARLQHASLCYGYRFALGGTTVAYCTDTGMTPALVRLARGADLLIAECSFTSGQTSAWGHLNPELAAGAAAAAGVRRLALMHFDAARYPARRDRLAAQRAARRIFPKTFVAFDGTVVDL